ncbi:MAG: RnfH family protein [Zoogloeaceae bacterium]|jgi:putative ubiquitin-RnfH superfamily antitoxin RatB of RatAB toxin-antitoxin module|nr:RnfH family protein [Zoogloeaceae bacterium]
MTQENSDFFPVEVVYALLSRQEVVRLSLPPGSVLQDALEASGFLKKYPHIDLARGRFGVFSKLAKMDTPLRAGDRVEIYRPLIADPRAARAARALGAAGKKAAVRKTEASAMTSGNPQ